MLFFAAATSFILLLDAVKPSSGHGLMSNPPSRNQLCGVVTKPHEVNGGNAEYPECGTAFNYLGPQGTHKGYEFMSVLTHDVGLAGVSALPNHVCGFDAETFGNDKTPWDAPMDWPTTTISPGRLEIEWDIFWGPHFDDTEEFRYWITKEDFEFDPTRELAWDDFETDAFCVLKYDDKNPAASPDVVANKGDTWFRTYCDVPNRPGRHVIYGEWGRNEYTYERFHGCIDVVIDGDVPTEQPPSPVPVPTPTQAPTTTDVEDATDAPTVSSGHTISPTFAPTSKPTGAIPAPTQPPVGQQNPCNVVVRSSNSQWFAALDIGFVGSYAVLNFEGTGLDLESIPSDKFQSGVFNGAVKAGNTIEITNPGWVSLGSLGFLGFSGPNIALESFTAPSCVAF